MKADKGQIFRIVQQNNILPITSKCNARCIFCSHLGNPMGIKVYTLPELAKMDILDLIEFLDPNKKIIIGESASNIIEGEPFLYKDIGWVLEKLRERFPKTLIQITTNGNIADRGLLYLIKELDNIHLNISVNCINRRKTMGILEDKLQSVLDYLIDNDIYFNLSMVILPVLTGWDIAGQTLEYMIKHKPKTINVYMPGFTRYTPANGIDTTPWEDIKNWLEHYKDSTEIPITLEPQILEDTVPVLEGVILGSPAHRAGLQRNDIILEANGSAMTSRVDMFETLRQGVNLQLKVKRENKILDIVIEKERNTMSGVVTYFDIDTSVVVKLRNLLNKGNATIMASTFGYKLLRKVLPQYIDSIIEVKNQWMGGNIGCAGLLTVSDFIRGLDKIPTDCKRIIIPSIPFDYRGNDLSGQNYLEIEDKAGIPVTII